MLGEDANRWEEMPNIVEQSFTQADLAPSWDARRPFTFLTIAQMTPKKGIGYAIEAFAYSFSSDPTVELRLGGDGPERERLEALARSLGVADQVKFLGMLTRQQVLEEMRQSQVFVLPSLYETFGVVVIEALALGKPLIATRCGGPESIVRPEDGLLISPGDPVALAEAMRRMRKNFVDYHPEAIRQACAERFAEAVIAKRLIAAYERVTSSHTRGDV